MRLSPLSSAFAGAAVVHDGHIEARRAFTCGAVVARAEGGRDHDERQHAGKARERTGDGDGESPIVHAKSQSSFGARVCPTDDAVKGQDDADTSSTSRRREHRIASLGQIKAMPSAPVQTTRITR